MSSFFPDFNIELEAAQENRYQLEGQYIYQLDRMNITARWGFSEIRIDQKLLLDGSAFSDDQSQITYPHGYVYGNLRFPDPALWSVGVAMTTLTRVDRHPLVETYK